jgi:hypothetical protein
VIQSIPTNSGVAPGDAVGGASNLTTVGAIPYVSASGVLNQDATALFWDAANDRLGIGTNAPTAGYRQTLTQPDNGFYTGLYTLSNNGSQASSLGWGGISGTLGFIIRSASSSGAIDFIQSSSTVGRFAATTGNLLIGGTTDGGYRLDVQTSGSTGTLRVYDQTATTGTTKAVVRAGAGQSGNLQEWQNSAGSALAYVTSSGQVAGSDFYNINGLYFQTSNVIDVAQNFQIRFSSTSTYGGSKDIGLARNAAGLLEINNGTAGTLRDLYLRRERFEAVTVANLPAAASWPGTVQYVTDANATTIGSTVAGGGANKVLVWSDGTNWKIYAN